MIYMKEVIGADERCTNIALQSFGICVDTPVMTGRDLDKILRNSSYTVYNYTYTKTDYEIGGPVLKHILGDGSEKFRKRILDVKTVGQFVAFLKQNRIYGHYLIYVSEHVLAVHYLKSGALYIVDAEERFLTKKRIDTLSSVEKGANLDAIFLNFLNNTDRLEKIKEI